MHRHASDSASCRGPPAIDRPPARVLAAARAGQHRTGIPPVGAQSSLSSRARAPDAHGLPALDAPTSASSALVVFSAGVVAVVCDVADVDDGFTVLDKPNRDTWLAGIAEDFCGGHEIHVGAAALLMKMASVKLCSWALSAIEAR